jgi:hypothetical protein
VRLLRILGPLLAAALAGAAPAQPIATSAGPDAVSVTVYRAPGRGSGTMELDYLQGFALISERRQVIVPAGEGSIRFEGVAGGIIPESAIVTGLPDGVVEKNQEALLLSPASLLERSLGRRVHLRRTSLATGKVHEHEAVIRSARAGRSCCRRTRGSRRCNAPACRDDRLPVRARGPVGQADPVRPHPQPGRATRDRHLVLPRQRLRLAGQLQSPRCVPTAARSTCSPG